eukprot:2374042-Amphidinium_carterae.5
MPQSMFRSPERSLSFVVQGAAASSSLDLLQTCADEDTEGHDAAHRVPRVFMWASTPCQSWSSMGKREKDGHNAEAYHNIWVEQRKHNVHSKSEDFYVHENSPLYPAGEKQVEAMDVTHKFISFCVAGSDLGLPYIRKRRYTCGYDKNKYVWTGGAEPEEQFISLFGRSVVATGDEYLVASRAEVLDHYCRAAAKRGNYLMKAFGLETSCTVAFSRTLLTKNQNCASGPPQPRSERLEQLPVEIGLDEPELLTQVLPEGALHRKQEWQQVRERLDPSLASAFLCDLDHHAGPGSRGPQGGSMMPTLITHSTIFSFRRRRLVTAKELFGVHGLLMSNSASPPWRYPWEAALEDMPGQHLESLVGNSLLLPAVAAFTFFVLSQLRRVDEHVDPIPLALQAEPASEDSAEEQ